VNASLLLGRILVASVELGVLFVLVTLLTRRLTRLGPRARSLLWIVVLARPLLTLTGATLVPFAVLDSPHPEIRQESFLRITEDVAPDEERVLVREERITSSSPVSFASILVGAWACGALLFLVRAVSARILLARLLSRCRPASKGVRLLSRKAARSLGLRRSPALLVTRDLGTPALAGILRPRILLPSWMVDDASPRQLLLVLRHELAHLRHRDTITSLVRRVAEAVFFFHPLVRRAGSMWEDEAEMACDLLVVRSGEEARTYARGLYRILVRSRQESVAPGLLCAARSRIGRRIEAILGTEGPTSPRRRGTALAALVGFLLILALPGVAVVTPDPSTVDTEEVEIELVGTPGAGPGPLFAPPR
jgi:beta-lactamase regulating signal transducer with metallopeptidase domain